MKTIYGNIKVEVLIYISHYIVYIIKLNKLYSYKNKNEKEFYGKFK